MVEFRFNEHNFFTVNFEKSSSHVVSGHDDSVLLAKTEVLFDRVGQKVYITNRAQSETPIFISTQNGVFITDDPINFDNLKLRKNALPFFLAQTANTASAAFEDQATNETIFESVKKIPQGHKAVINCQSKSISTELISFSDSSFTNFSEKSLANHLREVLFDTAETLTKGRREIWIELSGGIDSTLTAACVKKVTPANTRFYGVSLVYPQYEFRREEKFINYAAETLNCRVFKKNGDKALPFYELGLNDRFTLPNISQSGLAQNNIVYQTVATENGLLLNGHGGDLLFHVGPYKHERSVNEPIKLKWMNDFCFKRYSEQFDTLVKFSNERYRNSKELFFTGLRIDDKWCEKELTKKFQVLRTNIFLNPKVLQLISALWKYKSEKDSGKWILKKHFPDLIPDTILFRPGKVRYDGLYIRAYRRYFEKIAYLIDNYKDYLEENGINTVELISHVRRIFQKGDLTGDIQVSSVITFLSWLEGWKRNGVSLVS